MTKDPVYEDEEGWWFWDEFWADKHGPYPNEQHARGMLCMYHDHLLNEPKREPLTLREVISILGIGVLLLSFWVAVVLIVGGYFNP